MRPTLRGHLEIMRFDHWIKNVFVFPGIVVALTVTPAPSADSIIRRALIGLLAIGFVASSYYVLNELLDGETDRNHPEKRHRAVPSGRVSVGLGYIQWIVTMFIGVGIASLVSWHFVAVVVSLWFMGCIYNIPPMRTKDIPYLDVITESANNPMRMLAGWYMVDPIGLTPVSLLVAYWMVGAYFMASKRFAELRTINDPEAAARYRKSFRRYTEERLLVSIMFYAATAMLFLGAFLMRYRLELVLAFPFIGAVMAVYLALSFRPNSPVQAPERLYRHRIFLTLVVTSTVLMVGLLFVDVPLLHEIFQPTEIGP